MVRTLLAMRTEDPHAEVGLARLEDAGVDEAVEAEVGLTVDLDLHPLGVGDVPDHHQEEVEDVLAVEVGAAPGVDLHREDTIGEETIEEASETEVQDMDHRMTFVDQEDIEMTMDPEVLHTLIGMVQEAVVPPDVVMHLDEENEGAATKDHLVFHCLFAMLPQV